MRNPLLRIANADFGSLPDFLTGPAGSSVTLRADFTQDPPSGSIRYAWDASPDGCIEWGPMHYEPDFKREAILRGRGTVTVTAYDENGFWLKSSVVKVDPSTNTGEA